MVGVPKRRLVLWLCVASFALLLLADCTKGPSSAPTSQSYEGTRLEGTAHDFRLTDQNGAEIALSQFRGKVVVLAFMDTRCNESCPLTALELRKANEALGASSEKAAFLGVNVNAVYNSREDVQAFTAQYQLDQIPSWHFLTGTREQLSPVWAAFFIEVHPDPGEEDFEHTPGVFVIDQKGDKRWYISVPVLDDGLATPWPGPRLSDLLAKRVGELLAAPQG